MERPILRSQAQQSANTDEGQQRKFIPPIKRHRTDATVQPEQTTRVKHPIIRRNSDVTVPVETIEQGKKLSAPVKSDPVEQEAEPDLTGAEITVRFKKGMKGAETKDRIQGLPGVPKNDKRPQPGETWNVKVLGKNKFGSVFWLEPLSRVDE